MAFYLFWNQITLCNLEFFLSGIAGEVDDFHTVIQRLRNTGRIVCSCKEQHVAQIHRHFQIVVAESKVLFGVQYLKQCRGWISFVVTAQFIDLIEQHQRIHASCLLDGRDDSSRHCTDVSLAVTTDICLIAHTTQAHADIFSSHCCRNRLCNGCFSDTWRTNQTDDLSLDVWLKLSYCKDFQDSFLNLLQAIMVCIQTFLCRINIQLVLGHDIPWQRKIGVQIVSGNHRFLTVEHHLGKLVDLLADLFLGFLIWMNLF